ncbi:MAG: right-handed parallel beta-helix repeat-containing protein [Candidatus Cybelea sp.]
MIDLTQCNWPIKIAGTGNAKLTARFLGAAVDPVPGHFFDVDTSAGDNMGGMLFEDLTIKFPTTLSTAYDVAGIHITAATNLRINRCVFEECPIGVWLDNALQCAVSYCTFDWSSNFGIAIKCGAGDTMLPGGNYGEAKECHISHCVIAGSSSGGNTTGIVIEGSEHIRVDSTDMHGVYEGIKIIPGPYGNNALRHTFTDVTVYPIPDQGGSGVLKSAVTIQPQASSHQVAQIVFTSCFFEPDDGSAAPGSGSTTPGILVDATNENIETVRFVSCYSARWPGPGLKIMGATDGGTPQNIEVLGGMYSGNFNADTANNISCGIYLGLSTGVRLSGVSCVGQYEYVKIGSNTTSPHQYVGIYVDAGASDILIAGCDVRKNKDTGIYVNGGTTEVLIDSCNVTGNGLSSGFGIIVDGSSAAVTNVFIRNCDATGYNSYDDAIHITGTATNLTTVQVTGCAGYNDQSVPLTHSYPSGGLANFHGYNLGYYGPLEFYVLGASVTISSIKIGTVTTTLLQGSFFINPGEDAIIAWTPPTGTLTIPAIGK